MNGRAGELGLLFLVLLLTGATSWWLLLRSVPEADSGSLDALATNLGGWQAIDIEMDQAVADMLGADHNVQRAYHHPLGYTVFVYIGYYGSERGGVPEHTPGVCYPAQGWTVVASRGQNVGGRDGLDLREYVVESEGARRLVHFWYRTSQSSGITSILGLRMRQFLGRMTNEGTDGALIRLSIPLPDLDRPYDRELADGYNSARERLFALDLQVEAELDRVWPRAHRTASASSDPAIRSVHD